MDDVALQLERRDEHEAAARLRESSSRARHTVDVMNQLIREEDVVPAVED